MAIDGTDDYLTAEAEATQLVVELRELKKEVAAYRDARTALDDAADQLGTIARRLSELAAATAENVQTLREIGAPQLLEMQQQTLEKVQALTGLATTSLAQQAELQRVRSLLLGAVVAIAGGFLVVIVLLILGR